MRRLQRDLGALLPDLSLRGLLGAEQHLRRLGTSASQQAGKAKQLAFLQGHADVLHLARHPDVLCLQHVLRVFLHIRALQVEDHVYVLTDHLGDQLHLVQLADAIGADEVSVPQDSHAVGDLVHLVQEMGDEDDAHSFGLQLPHHLEQKLHLVVVQRGGGLVQDQDLCLHVHRAGDGNHLLDGGRVERQRTGDVDVQVEPFHQLIGPAVDGLPVDAAALHGLTAYEDVLGHGQAGNQHEVLMDHTDPQAVGLIRVVDLYFPSRRIFPPSL